MLSDDITDTTCHNWVVQHVKLKKNFRLLSVWGLFMCVCFAMKYKASKVKKKKISIFPNQVLTILMTQHLGLVVLVRTEENMWKYCVFYNASNSVAS